MSLPKIIVQLVITWIIMVPILHADHEYARYGVLHAHRHQRLPLSSYCNRGVNVATNTILISTVLSVLTVSGWLYLLGL